MHRYHVKNLYLAYKNSSCAHAFPYKYFSSRFSGLTGSQHLIPGQPVVHPRSMSVDRLSWSRSAQTPRDQNHKPPPLFIRIITSLTDILFYDIAF